VVGVTVGVAPGVAVGGLTVGGTVPGGGVAPGVGVEGVTVGGVPAGGFTFEFFGSASGVPPLPITKRFDDLSYAVGGITFLSTRSFMLLYGRPAMIASAYWPQPASDSCVRDAVLMSTGVWGVVPVCACIAPALSISPPSTAMILFRMWLLSFLGVVVHGTKKGARSLGCRARPLEADPAPFVRQSRPQLGGILCF
jgi:hypothetical protein